MRWNLTYEKFVEMSETLPVIIYGMTERTETIVGRHIDKSKIAYICDAAQSGNDYEGIPICPIEKLQNEKGEFIVVLAMDFMESTYLQLKSWGIQRIFPHTVFMYRARNYYPLIDYFKHYTYVLDTVQPVSTQKNPYPNKIWMFWYNGNVDIPPIFRHCLRSIEENAGEKEIILLNRKNMEHYVEIPGYIFDKHQRGYILTSELADILRLSLLKNYGGLWMDATVFLSGPIPKPFLQNRLFLYQQEFPTGIQRSTANWMISSDPHNPIIFGTLQCLLEYWKYEYYHNDYYIMHFYWDLVANYADMFQKAWAKVEFASMIPSLLLREHLFNPYDPTIWENLRGQTPVHKLSWKYPQEKYDLDDTFYRRIVAGQYGAGHGC